MADMYSSSLALQPDRQLFRIQKCDPVREKSLGQCKHLLNKLLGTVKGLFKHWTDIADAPVMCAEAFSRIA